MLTSNQLAGRCKTCRVSDLNFLSLKKTTWFSHSLAGTYTSTYSGTGCTPPLADCQRWLYYLRRRRALRQTPCPIEYEHPACQFWIMREVANANIVSVNFNYSYT